MITLEELFKKYSSTYRNRNVIFLYLLFQLDPHIDKSTKVHEGFGITTLILSLMKSRVLFYKLPSYLIERIKEDIKDDYYSSTLDSLAKKNALDQKRQSEKREPSYMCIAKGTSCIYKSCSEDEGDEFILEEDSKFFNINGIYKKEKDEEGGYYFE